MRKAIATVGVVLAFILTAITLLTAGDKIGVPRPVLDVGAVAFGVFLIALVSVILFVTIAALIHFAWTYFLRKTGRRTRRVLS